MRCPHGGGGGEGEGRSHPLQVGQQPLELLRVSTLRDFLRCEFSEFLKPPAREEEKAAQWKGEAGPPQGAAGGAGGSADGGSGGHSRRSSFSDEEVDLITGARAQ